MMESSHLSHRIYGKAMAWKINVSTRSMFDLNKMHAYCIKCDCKWAFLLIDDTVKRNKLSNAFNGILDKIKEETRKKKIRYNNDSQTNTCTKFELFLWWWLVCWHTIYEQLCWFWYSVKCCYSQFQFQNYNNNKKNPNPVFEFRSANISNSKPSRTLAIWCERMDRESI